jgi:hypothetical protein
MKHPPVLPDGTSIGNIIEEANDETIHAEANNEINIE